VRDRQALRPNFFSTIPVALTGAAQLRADGISSCFYIAKVHNVMSYVTQERHGLEL
jgi:hypothetical protein